MNPQLAIKFAASLAALTVMTALGGSHAVLAAAPSPQVPQSLRANCQSAITNRLSLLNSNIATINATGALTSGHRAALLAAANKDITGLTSLEPKIASDATVAQTLSDCGAILSEYRVYILFEPQVWEAITADQITTADTKVQPAITAIQAAIDAGNSPASVKAQAEAALNDISSRLRAAESDVTGVADNALAQTPSGYPSNLHVLVDGLTSLQNAWNQLQGIATDFQTLAGLDF